MATAAAEFITQRIPYSTHYKGGLGIGVLVLADASVISLSFWLSIQIWGLFKTAVDVRFYETHWVTVPFFIAIYALGGLYRVTGTHPVSELRTTTVSTTSGFIILVLATFLSKEGAAMSRAITVISWALTIVAMPLARSAARRRGTTRAWFLQDAILIGAGSTGRNVIDVLRKHPEIGLLPVGVLDDCADPTGDVDGIPIIGKLQAAREVARATGVRHGILALRGHERMEAQALVSEFSGVFPSLLVIPDLSPVSSLWADSVDFGGLLAVEVRHNLLRPKSVFLKSATDRILGGAAMLLLLPVLAIVAAAVAISSPGRVLYSQTRMGHSGKSFKLWKFRSMIENAESVLAEHLASDPGLAEEWKRDQKLKCDPRVTAVGRILRRWSLDELPQLWNILRGEMSLVGPRPITAAEVSRYGRAYSLYRQVRPGITGLWQISGRSNTSYSERVESDEYYVRNWSVWLDTYILARTLSVVLSARGAY